MREIIEAVTHLRRAFAERGLEPPVLVSLDPAAFRHLKALAGSELVVFYAQQGGETVEIAGVRFTDRVPAGFHERAVSS